MSYEKYRQLAKEMIMAGVRAADPTNAVRNNVRVEGRHLIISGTEYDLDKYDRVLLFGIGKASTPMCAAFESILVPDGGLAITKLGAEINIVETKTIPIRRAYHPEPREVNIEYSQEIWDMVNAISPDDKVLIVFMVSGGGSALFDLPPEGVSIDDLFLLNRNLMWCGATIYDINTIRKHVSKVKGGRFAQFCAQKGADVAALIVSDVVGDDLSVIASGPTYKDDTTFEDAIRLMKEYGIWDKSPESVRKHLEKGLTDPSMEPPREVPANTKNFLIGTNMVAVQAAKQVAEEAGLPTMILTTQNTGEAKYIAKCVMGIAKEIQDSGNPVKPPVAIIMGGEMTVTFDWEDANGFGPNREFVLASAIEIANRDSIVVAGVDTDGVDGEGKSGAIADPRTVHRTKLNAKYYLDKHDAEIYFDDLGDSLQFESRTNVNDLDVIIVGPKGAWK